jgi:hypothetical protein
MSLRKHPYAYALVLLLGLVALLYPQAPAWGDPFPVLRPGAQGPQDEAWLSLEAAAPGGCRTELLSTDPSGVEWEVQVDGLWLGRMNLGGESYATVRLEGEGYTTELGKPTLPVVRRFVEIPYGAQVQAELLEADRMTVALGPRSLPPRVVPLQPSVRKGEEASGAEVVRDPGAYAGVYPGVALRVGEPMEWRGHRFVLVELFLVQADGTRGELEVLRRARIRLSWEGAQWEVTRAAYERCASPAFEKAFEVTFLNHEAFQTLVAGDRWIPPTPVGYLIVAGDDFVPALDALVQWKTAKGFVVTLAPTSETGTTLQAITNYIQDAYQNWDVPPTYVLLVGDVEWIPAYVGQDTGSETDLYYVTVNPGDYFPEMMIGRFPCRTVDEAQAMVDKVVGYEMATFPDDAWTAKACFIASDDPSWHWLAEETHRYVMETYMIPSGVACDSIWGYYGGSTQDVRDALNDGRMITNYSGHGAETYWVGPHFSQNDVRNLTNDQMYPFVISNACVTGSYAMTECFGETWVRVANRGAINFWGASDYTYWYEDDILERRMYDALYTERFETIGGMTDRALVLLYQHYGGGGYSQYYFEAYNIMGDPSLLLWTHLPQTLAVNHPDAVIMGQSTFEVDVATARAPVDSALVCLFVDGQLHAAAYTDASGHAVLDLGAGATQPGTATLTVTGHNLRPYQAELPIVAPALVDIQPPQIPIMETTDVTVTVTDTLGVGMEGVLVRIYGWGVGPDSSWTDASGQAFFTLTPPYGETLHVVGRRPGDDYDLFDEPLPVTGGDMLLASVTAEVPEIGLDGALTPFYEGILHATGNAAGFSLYARGCGVDTSAATSGTTLDLSVVPTETGTLETAVGKEGYRIVLVPIDVIPVFGTLDGVVQAEGGGPGLEGARVRGWPAGADTSQQAPVFDVVTGTGGSFVVEGEIPCGPYDVYLTCFGYLDTVTSYMVLYGENHAVFEMPPAPSGVVSGYLTDAASGDPLVGTVSVYRPDTGDLYQEVQSNAQGFYEVTLPYFTYTFRASAPQHQPEVRTVTVDQPQVQEDFQLWPTQGNVLVVDDESGKAQEETPAGKTDPRGSVPAKGVNAQRFVTELENLGYTVTLETAAETDPATWEQYDILVWSAGENISPVSQSSWRTALVNYVSAGGHLLIEGGEVGYDACSYPGYPDLASEVLHATTWYQDSSGDLQVTVADHPVVSFPNTLPGVMSHAYNGWGSEDGLGVASDALGVCGWTSGSGSGLIVYDDDNEPTNGGQIVFFAFHIEGLTDATARSHLIENAVTWLLPAGPAAAPDPGRPVKARLVSWGPNPTSQAVRFRLELPEARSVTLRVFDVAGRQVARRIWSNVGPGLQEILWDPASLGRGVSGIYWVRMEAGQLRETARVVVLR